MLRAVVVVVLAALVPAAPACKSSESAPPAETGGGEQQSNRLPLVPRNHEFYGRLEGPTFKNDCEADAGCFRGGCSAETCTAQSDVMGTCDVLPVQIPTSARCGCVLGECIWWSDGSATLIEGAAGEQAGEQPREQPAEQPGGACGDKTCAPGEQCIEYYGVAGPRGPKFQTCGIPCKSGKCPDGKKCVTIADGPGPVCQ